MTPKSFGAPSENEGGPDRIEQLGGRLDLKNIDLPPSAQPIALGVDVGKPVYRTRTIKRVRRTKARIEQLKNQMFDVLREDQPQSVRHMFYRMTNPRLTEPVEKSDAGYRHVQDRLVKMRRSGAVPYGWITDATRRGYFEAMPAGILRQLLRDHIEALLPPRALEVAKVAEQEERILLNDLADLADRRARS